MPSCSPAAQPTATSLYQLLDKHYETVKGLWEERFERRYGFWQGYWDNAVASYLDCGLFENPPRAPPEPSEITVH